MKIIAALALTQLFLLATGSGLADESKKLGCMYTGFTDPLGTLCPEDIDVSLCTHVIYIHGSMNNETEEIEIKSSSSIQNIGEGFVARLVKLKAVNPDLKLILFITSVNKHSLLDPFRGNNVINNGVKWLNETGFDGLGFFFSMGGFDRVMMAALFCDMKSEFDKYGYMLTAIVDVPLFSGPGNEEIISNLARCFDHVTLMAESNPRKTNRISPMQMIKSDLDWYLKRGFPANKMILAAPAFGMSVRLHDPSEAGANISEPVIDYRNISGGDAIHYKELVRILNDSSMGWTFHRDEHTREAYAFSKTGLWTSYEDTDSMSFKARYVLEKGLMGMDIFAIDMDDAKGIGGKGKFPLARTIYNTFRRQNQSVDTT